LHGHAVGFELEVRFSAYVFAIVRVGEKRFLDIIKMRVEDLLRKGKLSRLAQYPPYLFKSGGELLVWRRAGGKIGLERGSGVVSG
jgi:hypothetical protein